MHQMWADVTKWQETLVHDKSMAAFAKSRALAVVYLSNKLEGTLAKGTSEQETYALLDELWEQPSPLALESPAIVLWHSEGQHSSERSLYQLQQHLLALRHLQGALDQPLSVELVCETHRILMKGALSDETTAPIRAGRFRQHHCCAGKYSFPEAGTISASLSKIIEQFNERFATRKLAPYRLAAWLFVQVITLHPFENGNGRLCRLLASYVFQKCGVPFPVVITSGHSRAYKHYIDAIVAYQTRGQGLDELCLYMLTSLHQSWSIFAATLNHS
ncbi:hypothetical protein CAOG_06713 [Capsaspora owczarzaki ATCC 30864]|uniref:Fido domain-containing protein n=1 Tax=Capsaspora owczarzaki (strain ATCC 30864) TaxID=595528 RepID=A0A0D2WVR6_CAPO3|nr:hypothetical protein CAOG_06713 [Capsaspora owczarzaki ATCC 30864]KJE96378.1 hypothetical protein CAOG_006713 [Capsaspora owczarzaki ATCC 30864]|eukprot:XP_004344334.1 hypothetical protein CAOG_06713 [Capsaspora owczarzaki ATCC 30864]